MNYYDNPKRFYQALVPDSAAVSATPSVGVFYTSPATVTGDKPTVPRSAILTEMLIANADTVDRTLTLYLVPSGGSKANTNIILPTVTIEGNTFTRLTFATVMPQGSSIQGLADTTNKICLTISGVERIPLS